MRSIDDFHTACGLVQRAADKCGVSCFMVGRLAVMACLRGKIDNASIPQTMDLDLAFMVREWRQYEAICRELIAGNEDDFRADPRAVQRLTFQRRLPIDMVPAGPIADARGKIHWPPDGSFVMTVLGFDDADRDAQPMDLGGVTVRVATPRALALLKLIAWDDRRDRTKDIDDLALLMKYYDLLTDPERLYAGPDADLIEADNFDLEHAWTRILGRDVGRLIRNPLTVDLVRAILRRELDGRRLDLAELLRGFLGVDLDAGVERLATFHAGFEEGLAAQGRGV